MSEIDDLTETIEGLERVIERLTASDKHMHMELAKLQDAIDLVLRALSINMDPNRHEDAVLLRDAYNKYIFTRNLVLGKDDG